MLGRHAQAPKHIRDRKCELDYLVRGPACDSEEIYLHPTVISGAPSQYRTSEAGITVPPLGREPALQCTIRRLITRPQLSPEVGLQAGVERWEWGVGGSVVWTSDKHRV